MATKQTSPSITIPLQDLKCISTYPKEHKIICEINTKGLETMNKPHTLDEVINAGRIPYILGNYKSFTNATDIIAELNS